MERISFLIEKTGENISCLLNPESLVQRRQAGITTLSGSTGQITGSGLSDDPIVATGGGITEYDIDLLFDTDIARTEMASLAQPSHGRGQGDSGEILLTPSKASTDDVRSLTRPIWALTENAAVTIDQRGAPPAVRMIWGRAWNVLGVVVSVAERLERFTEKGVPQRSWLRLRLRRVSESVAGPAIQESVTPQYDIPPPDAISGGSISFAETNVSADGFPVSRLDQIAADEYGDPSAWRLIAGSNDIENPLDLPEGSVLALPRLGGQQ